MEYWEGFFLGKYWSDSDFKDHRHKFLFVMISLIVFVFAAFNFFLPEKVEHFLLLPVVFNFVLGTLLLIGLPFAAMFYYRLPFAVRPLILLAYLAQYYFLFCGLIQLMTGQMNLEVNSLPDLFLNLFDRLMVFSGDLFTFLGGLGSTIASVAGAMLLGGLVGLMGILISIFIPLLYLLLFRYLQRLIDRLVYNRIYLPRFQR